MNHINNNQLNKEQLKKEIKQKIAISNFQEEEKGRMKKRSNYAIKIASVACIMLVSITGIVFAKEIGNFVKGLFGGNASDGVNIAVKNGYVENVNLTYQDFNGIEIAIDSFMMDDNNFDMNFRVKLREDYNLQNMMMGMELYDLKIVDENQKTVFATSEIQQEEMLQYKTEEEAKENYDSYDGGYGTNAEIIGENEIMYYLTATENPVSFPKSKKLFVTFTRIHVDKDFYEQPIDEWYTGDWKFELEVPEEMYQREIIKYKVVSCSDENTVVEKAILSNTSFKISIPFSQTDKIDYDLLKVNDTNNINDKIAFQKEYVETSDGRKFGISKDGNGEYSVPEGEKQIKDYSQSFNLTRYDASDELIVHIFTNTGKEIQIKFEKE